MTWGRRQMMQDGELYIVTFREKYVGSSYLVRGMSGMHKLALEKLEERVDIGYLSSEPYEWTKDRDYWRDERMTLEEAEQLACMTDEELAAVPGPVYASVEKRRKQAKTWLREHAEANAQTMRVAEALRTKNGEVALEILQERQDYEYEGWDYEPAGEVYE